MKNLSLVVAAAVALCCVSAFATNARVESMGKNSTFIMDDMSIFDNPANMNLYPNFLIGELGNYLYHPDSVKAGQNRDPLDPWFGGIFSLGIGAEKAISIGGVLGRKDERLLKFLPDYIVSSSGREIRTPEPVTNFDGFLGANINNVALGAHIYVAHQDGLNGNNQIDGAAFASVVQLDIGTNIEISSRHAFELSLGTARIQYGPEKQKIFDPDLFSFFGRTRAFSKIDAINGHLIPAASIYNTYALGDREKMNLNLGIGVDAAFDRGFFWMGLNGFYDTEKAGRNWYRGIRNGNVVSFYEVYDYGDQQQTSKLWQLGGTISFGIERNIWWDWFVIRVGGQKTIAYADYTSATNQKNSSILCPSSTEITSCPESGNYFVTNPVSDGTREDNVGFGFGVNIEEKLKVDATVAEDLLFRNPFQGGSRLMSRISATYSF
jgi:hypothetical protein